MELVICGDKEIVQTLESIKEEIPSISNCSQLIIESPKEIPVEYNKKCLECLMFEKPCKKHINRKSNK